MSLYEVNNKPTLDKVNSCDEDGYTFYRFQNKDWEIGTKSWGMIYDNEEEAIKNCEDDGLTPSEAILDGKSCCDTANELWNYAQYYGKDFRVLIVEGNCVGTGHDGESVVDISNIKEIWDYKEFIEFLSLTTI